MSWNPFSSGSSSSPYTMRNFRDTAQSFFRATTGQSPRVSTFYNSLTDDELNQPITALNIGNFVRRENHAVLHGTTPATREDLLAIAAIPLRAVAAHTVAQNVVVGQQGFFGNCEYQQEALIGTLSGLHGQ